MENVCISLSVYCDDQPLVMLISYLITNEPFVLIPPLLANSWILDIKNKWINGGEIKTNKQTSTHYIPMSTL